MAQAAVSSSSSSTKPASTEKMTLRPEKLPLFGRVFVGCEPIEEVDSSKAKVSDCEVKDVPQYNGFLNENVLVHPEAQIPQKSAWVLDRVRVASACVNCNNFIVFQWDAIRVKCLGCDTIMKTKDAGRYPIFSVRVPMKTCEECNYAFRKENNDEFFMCKGECGVVTHHIDSFELMDRMASLRMPETENEDRRLIEYVSTSDKQAVDSFEKYLDEFKSRKDTRSKKRRQHPAQLAFCKFIMNKLCQTPTGPFLSWVTTRLGEIYSGNKCMELNTESVRRFFDNKKAPIKKPAVPSEGTDDEGTEATDAQNTKTSGRKRKATSKANGETVRKRSKKAQRESGTEVLHSQSSHSSSIFV